MREPTNPKQKDNMRTFKYESDNALPTTVKTLVARWAARRPDYVMSAEVHDRTVEVELLTIPTHIHNRACDSLARIVTRAIHNHLA